MATATIKSIHIENFRSIRLIDVDVSQISIFVGKNDCGKSNILRALNLFFNGETNPGVKFNFYNDYNLFSPERSRKAKEVVVRLEIALPETYHATNGHVIQWTKRWRKDGHWTGEYDYYGQRILRSPRGREIREDVKISSKSNVRQLLSKIDFEYVPAVKDSTYFDDLQGRIYGIISDVAARTFHDSSAAFEHSIGEHLSDLTSSISGSLGFDTRLALPRDLSHIFERLDFLSGEKSVSLNNRGDGVKARHIPLILKFMAEKKAELLRRGGAPVSSIWAYEEPENNLELGSAIQLADELHALAKAGTAQVLLTTHSPAFYDLGRRESGVTLNFVMRSKDVVGTEVRGGVDGVDESMGTLAILTPRISEMVEDVRQQEAAKAEAARLAEESCARIFVEGESDRIVLSRALQIFFPEAVERVRFETKTAGGGHKYVIDMLNGWRAQHKHHPGRPKAAGIVDGDAAEARNNFNNCQGNAESAKCFVYPKHENLRAALAAGFIVSSTLETLYPRDVWKYALEHGYLSPRDLHKVYSPVLTEKILRGQARGEDFYHPDWQYLVTHDFDSGRKISTANYLYGKDDSSCRDVLANFEAILKDVLRFLGVIDPQ